MLRAGSGPEAVDLTKCVDEDVSNFDRLICKTLMATMNADSKSPWLPPNLRATLHWLQLYNLEFLLYINM